MNNTLLNSKEITSTSRSFLLPFEDACIHIIETGHLLEDRRFIVVTEDAYMLDTGKSEVLTKMEINKKYNIKL